MGFDYGGLAMGIWQWESDYGGMAIGVWLCVWLGVSGYGSLVI